MANVSGGNQSAHAGVVASQVLAQRHLTGSEGLPVNGPAAVLLRARHAPRGGVDDDLGARPVETARRRASDSLDRFFPDHEAIVLIVDRNCRVLRSSDAARRILSEDKKLRMRNGVLQHDDAALQKRLKAVIVEATVTGVAGRLALPGEWGEAFVLRVAPSRTDGHTGCAAVRVERRHIFAMPDTQDLQNVFGLSHAEARLLAQLVSGRQLGECAEILGVKVNTVRSQMTSILRKTDCSRQPELVRLASLVAQP